MELTAGTVLHGFRINRVREITDCMGTLYEMTHEKTGAQLCWLKRDDENKTFSITFKTIPSDDTGVFHMLEHSVLNGSEKYPVKEPFVELLKSSMQTFLNAFTYPDKTMYPVSSRSEKDFMNLMSVYMDAVFHPAIYTNPNIFRQEGWHYEIRDPEEEPVYKGVVLNEMKGAFSSVDEMILNEINRNLFPDNCYRYVSGGDPAHITELSYEQFIETHSHFYHPSNARVFLDGDLDLEPVLAFIDDEYFSKYEKEDMNFDIPMQEVLPGSDHEILYEISEEEDPENKAVIACAAVISDYTNVMKNMAWEVLGSILVANNESKYVKAVLDRGLGEDAEMTLMGGIQQPFGVFLVRNTTADKLPQIKELVRDVTAEIIKEGVDREEIISTLNLLEFQYREKHEPAGVINAQKSMDSWLYGGDPAMYISCGDMYETLRQKAQEGYFEELLKEFPGNEEKLTWITAIPSASLGAQRTAKEKEKLSQIKKSWDADTLGRYIEENRVLDVWQNTPDTEEKLGTLPQLKLEDVNMEIKKTETEVKNYLGVPILVHPAGKAGITYISAYFSLAGLTREDLPSVSMFTELMLDLGTKQHNVRELQAVLKKYLGNMAVGVECHTPYGNPAVCLPMISMSVSVLDQNAEKAVELMTEVLRTTVYEKEAIRPIVRQDVEEFRQSLIMSGHSAAMRRITAHNTAEGVFREYAGGYECGLWETSFNKNFDEEIDGFLNDCELYQENLFTQSRMTVSVSGNEELAKKLIDQFEAGGAQRSRVRYPLLEEKKESILIPSGVSYSAYGNTIREYDAVMLVMSHILTYGYLWQEVRVRGGAYGTGFTVNSNMSCAAYSYRDPDPKGALNAYRHSAEYIRALCQEEDTDLTSYIIGALASGEPLIGPAARYRILDARYFRNITDDLRAETRRKMLECTKEDLLKAADVVEEALQDGNVCIVGPKEVIDSLAAEGYKQLRQE